MNRNSIQYRSKLAAIIVIGCLPISLTAQSAPEAPVSYASMSQLNGMLSQLEQTSNTTQLDLANLRIERWKTDSKTKQQLQSDVDSLGRNMRYALPDILGQVRVAPENVAATFKLYRNLAALYDVLSSVVESAGAFGRTEEYQALASDLTALDQSRRTIGDRVESLAIQQETELGNLRTELHRAQAELIRTPPKKIIVDENEPAKVHKGTSKTASRKTSREKEREREEEEKKRKEKESHKPSASQPKSAGSSK
jgi:hypothetical protein